MGVWQALKRDYERNFRRTPRGLGMLRAFFVRWPFQAIVYYRVGAWAQERRWRWLGALCRWLMSMFCQCEIDLSARIAPGFAIRHGYGLVIGTDVIIGPDCDARQGVTLGGNQGRRNAEGRTDPVLESGVSLGVGCKVLGPVRIGAGSVIGANAVVLDDVPPNCVVAGIPARVIRRDGEPVPWDQRGDKRTARLLSLEQRLAELEQRLRGGG